MARQNYTQAIAAITKPTLVVIGNRASSISTGKQDTPDQRLADYLECLSQAEGIKNAARNVLPNESTTEFVVAIAAFIAGSRE